MEFPAASRFGRPLPKRGSSGWEPANTLDASLSAISRNAAERIATATLTVETPEEGCFLMRYAIYRRYPLGLLPVCAMHGALPDANQGANNRPGAPTRTDPEALPGP
jgi:hypothetical protein